MIGRQLGPYRIVEQIGSGGMAVVYKGFDTSLDRMVAVKFLHPHLASRDESRRRFSREAKAVARLHHRNILEIYAFSGEDVPDSYIVTEYIRGKTLRRFADEEPFHPPEIAAMAGHELAGALDHAHAIGVIHRDLKPENIMIREDGVLKLMDFGIAKIVDRDERMTITGALVGSPAHMAPEVIEGAEAGVEADIFSLGTILYWLCTRKLPFAGNNTTQTLKLILDGAYADPRTENPAVSDELAQVIARCLARDAKDRFPTASGLREALDGALKDAGVEHPGNELARFFAEPSAYRGVLAQALVVRLVDQAGQYLRAGRNPRALNCVNRVLAFEPSNPKALHLLERMKRRRRLKRAASVAGAALLAVGCIGGLGAYIASRPPPPRPAVAMAPRAFEPSFGADDERMAVHFIEVRGKARPVALAGVRPAPDKPTRPAADVLAVPGVPARLSLVVWEVPADILLDDRKIGVKVVNDAEVPSGVHIVSIRHPCCEPVMQQLELLPGKAHPLPLVRLTPRPARIVAAVRDGKDAAVVVWDESGGTRRLIQNGATGAPIAVGMLKVGDGWTYQRRVRVEVTRQGAASVMRDVVLRAGQEEKLDVDLVPK